MQTYYLYSDGNYFPRAKKSGFGGYIQNSLGEILVEYSEQIKKPDYIFSFELLGIIRGLQIAKSRGIDSIVSHCDDKNTAFKLKEIFEDKIFNVTPSMKPELYQEIVDLAKDFKKIRFEYIPRADNKYADSLSRRYASMMEENFLKQYNQEIYTSSINLKNPQPPKKRVFFSHPNIIQSLHKNNPFLVAQYRNKKVRKVSKAEQQHSYHYLFTELFQKDNDLLVFQSVYDKDYKSILEKKSIIQNCEDPFLQYTKSLVEILNHDVLKNNPNVWIDTNYRHFNNIFEQKEKINITYWSEFQSICKSLDSFKRVFFNHFPFEPKYQPENEHNEKLKKTLENNIESLDSLLNKLENGVLTKEKNKHFGAIIRYHLKQYEERLQRELSDIEKSQIIEKTVSDLKELGFSQTPKNMVF